MGMLPDERYHFRGLGKFVAVGVGLAALEVGAAAALLTRALRGGPRILITAAGLGAGGVAQTLLFLSCRRGDVRLTDDGVVVRLGRLWHETIPYHAIAAAVPVRRSVGDGFGIRTDRQGTVAVVPWGLSGVELDLVPSIDLPIFPGYH